MSIMSKRIVVNEVNISSDGRNHGDTQLIMELDPKKLIIREVKTLHTAVNSEIDLSDPNVKTDLFLSSEYGKSIGVNEAVAGAVLFGAKGAVAGGVLGRGKDLWILELTTPDGVRIFKLQKDADKKTLEKYLAKF